MKTRRPRLYFVIPIALLVTLSTHAQTAGETEDPEDSQVTVEETEPEVSQEPAVLPVPSADNLRTPDLGDALKNFRPSEEISADNAVPFPVDI